MLPVSEAANPKNITSTTTVFTGPGALIGIWVSSASGSPTLKVQDGANTLANTFTPVAATWYTLPFRFSTSLIVTVGGTVDCTIGWSQ